MRRDNDKNDEDEDESNFDNNHSSDKVRYIVVFFLFSSSFILIYISSFRFHIALIISGIIINYFQVFIRICI